MFRKIIMIEMLLVFVCAMAFVFPKTRYMDSAFYAFGEPVTLCQSEHIDQSVDESVLSTGSVIHPFGVSETTVFFYLDGDNRRHSLPINSFDEANQILEYVHEKKDEINRAKLNAVSVGFCKAFVASLVIGVLLTVITKSRIDSRYKCLIVYAAIGGTIVIALVFWSMALSTR